MCAQQRQQLISMNLNAKSAHEGFNRLLSPLNFSTSPCGPCLSRFSGGGNSDRAFTILHIHRQTTNEWKIAGSATLWRTPYDWMMVLDYNVRNWKHLQAIQFVRRSTKIILMFYARRVQQWKINFSNFPNLVWRQCPGANEKSGGQSTCYTSSVVGRPAIRVIFQFFVYAFLLARSMCGRVARVEHMQGYLYGQRFPHSGQRTEGTEAPKLWKAFADYAQISLLFRLPVPFRIDFNNDVNAWTGTHEKALLM